AQGNGWGPNEETGWIVPLPVSTDLAQRSGTPFARFANDNPAHDLRLRPDAKEFTMTLTATRETGTVRPTSSPTLRFLGGVGVMLLASTVGAWILAMLPPGPPPSGEDAILTGIMGSIAGNVLG